METLNHRRDRIEEHLEAVLEETEPAVLREQMQQVTLSGGKRVRPTITVLVCDALEGDIETAVEFAVGIELVHNASLVIDDIIDESELRRGGPSAWTAFGHGPAIVTSDGLLGEAFAQFAPDSQAIETVSEALVQLGEGEATELTARPTSEAEYMQLARRKTGALFRAAAELGAIAADADARTVEAFGRYAERVGVAFQIRDDVLDATADTERLGKPSGRDADLDRPSIVEVTPLSPAAANERAHEESEAALEALAGADIADSRSRTYLEQLGTFVVERER
jgi:geranylgeranyl diphosphate synthase type I